MKVAVTGATGFIGRRLVSRLVDAGTECIVLTRSQEHARSVVPFATAIFEWVPSQRMTSEHPLEGVDAVVHLAGEPVAQRWTARARTSIRESRVASTRSLAETLAAMSPPPRTLISASAVGFYGPRDDNRLDEDASGGDDFLSGVCREWEAAADPAREAGIRVVHPRIGVVLGPGGGAMSMMLMPFRLGVGGPIGHGRQWMSWIHIDDVVGILIHALEIPDISGPLNTTAPEPVRNKEFARTLGRALHRPAWLPIPVVGLRLLYGDFARVLATGQRVIPAKALSSGYRFGFGGLLQALEASVR